MKAQFYDIILQGDEATEENAYNLVCDLDWKDLETTEQDLPNLRFIDSLNGISIYYDFGADYYCFTETF